MGSVYSTQFLTSKSGASATYLVPSGYRAVIREITAFNGNLAIPETAQIFFQGSGIMIWNALLDGQSYVAEQLRTVLNPGDRFLHGNGPDVDMVVSGYLLSLP